VCDWMCDQYQGKGGRERANRLVLCERVCVVCACVYGVGVDALCGQWTERVDYNVSQGRFKCLLEHFPAFPHKLYLPAQSWNNISWWT
jgi:hypothetical protein